MTPVERALLMVARAVLADVLRGVESAARWLAGRVEPKGEPFDGEAVDEWCRRWEQEMRA